MSRVEQARQRAVALADERDQTGRSRPEWIKPLPPFEIAPRVVDAFSLEDAPVSAPAEPVEPVHESPECRLPAADRTLSALQERLDGGTSHKIVVRPEIAPSSREQYRLLAAALHNSQSAAGTSVVMVTSALAGEGKTLTVANLALTLSESYHRRVLLVDADLRSPGLHTLLGLDNSTGLSDGLFAPDRKTLRLQQVTTRLAVLTTGPVGPDPMAGLTSERMRQLLQEARATFDWTLIDTPPVALLPDANLLASKVDGAVLVVRAGATPLELVQRAVGAVGRGKVLGVVLNAAHERARMLDYTYYPTTDPLRIRDCRQRTTLVVLENPSMRFATLVIFETILIITGVAIAAYVRLGDGAWAILLNEHGALKAGLIAAVSQVCLYYAELYDLRIVSDRRELFIRMLQALGSASFVLAALYFWFPFLIIGRGVFMIAAMLVITFVIGWRVAFEWLSGRVRPRERLLLVGTSPGAVALAREIFEQRHRLAVEIVGFVDPDPARVGAAVLNPGVIGSIEDIPSIVRARGVDRVVVSLADARGRLPMDKLLEMKLDGVSFDHLASVYEDYTGKIAVENLRPSWLIFSDGFKKGRLLSAAKRLLDVIMAMFGVIVATPVALLVALAIKLESSGSVLYHQRRVGRQGRIFVIHKFRSMRMDAEAGTGPVWASKNGDPRITRVGRWLRRTRLDELPQLWNVLLGDMSIVGPRPERPEFVAELARQIRFYGQRHVVRPGITGWAQVRYTYAASTEDALQKLQYDLYYIKNLSVALDLFIILNTIKTVVLHKGA